MTQCQVIMTPTVRGHSNIRNSNKKMYYYFVFNIITFFRFTTILTKSTLMLLLGTFGKGIHQTQNVIKIYIFKFTKRNQLLCY